MTSRTEICNIALAELGSQLILDITDISGSAPLCDAIYDSVVNEVISSGRWASCTFRAQLSLTAEQNPFQYTYGFSLPEDPKCLVVIETDLPGEDYLVEGRTLLSNRPAVSIRYRGRPGDESTFEPSLVRAISLRLKAALAYPLTGSGAKEERCLDEYRKFLLFGIGIQQGLPRTLPAGDLISVRP
jgi:hypothetical protein